MDISPLDIFLVIFSILFGLLGIKNGIISESKKTISLLCAIILTNIITVNLSKQLYFLNNRTDVMSLGVFLIILTLNVLLLGFILDFVIEQIDDLNINKYANYLIGCTLGIIKGIILTALLIFIFDSTPVDNQYKDIVYQKIEKESLLFKQYNNLKSILFKN